MEFYQKLVNIVGEDNAAVVVFFVALAILGPIVKSMFRSLFKSRGKNFQE